MGLAYSVRVMFACGTIRSEFRGWHGETIGLSWRVPGFPRRADVSNEAEAGRELSLVPQIQPCAAVVSLGCCSSPDKAAV